MSIYKPTNGDTDPIALKATFGVKFCQDTMLMKSFLDQRHIPYTDDELEDTPFGKCLRIKKKE